MVLQNTKMIKTVRTPKKNYKERHLEACKLILVPFLIQNGVKSQEDTVPETDKDVLLEEIDQDPAEEEKDIVVDLLQEESNFIISSRRDRKKSNRSRSRSDKRRRSRSDKRSRSRSEKKSRSKSNKRSISDKKSVGKSRSASPKN